MNKLWTHLVDFQKKYFDLRLYTILFIFIAVCLILNYYFDFEDTYVDKNYGTWLHFLQMFAFQFSPFLCVSWLLFVLGKVPKWHTNSQFWITAIIGFAIISFDRSFHLGEILRPFMHAANARLLTRVINWIMGSVQVTLLFVLYYYSKEKVHSNIYGLIPRKFDPKPYFELLGIALIFIGIGSFFSDIQSYYPRYSIPQGNAFASRHGIQSWIAMFLFEMGYGLSFIKVELIFRGFLIHAFMRYFGPYSVLPMISVYCFYHFGKPATEAISSIFGGYALGILAIDNKNIWGGVIIHIGIAWSMELFGYLQS